MALSIIRQIEDEGVRGRSKEVVVNCPVSVANFIVNQKRDHITNIEARFYTALAKQITDNVFGSDGLQQDSGTFTSPIGGEVVTWATPSGTGNVTVTVTEEDGTVTTFTMPKEDNS